MCRYPGGAVSGVSLGSTDLLQYIDPLPIDQLLYHEVQAVRAWPECARNELLAVAQRDVAVARQNLAELTRYVDIHAAHLAACSSALDDSIPLMSVETFPRTTGGIRSALDNVPVWCSSLAPGVDNSYSGQGMLAFCLPGPFLYYRSASGQGVLEH